MPKKTVFVASDNRKAVEFIAGYFADTQSIPSIIRVKSDLPVLFETRAHMVFIQSEWLDKATIQHFSGYKVKTPDMKLFVLGRPPSDCSPDGEIEFPVDDKAFRKTVLAQISYPEKINLLVVDDEPEIGEMVQDYFEVRQDPAFKIRLAHNGLEAFKMIEQEKPDCLVLDIKMPVRNGIELFQDLVKSGRKIPTIMFIDSSASDEIMEVRKWGSPSFVEKGGHYSSMPDMLALVKKLVAFS